jgi:hypothetical protein
LGGPFRNYLMELLGATEAAVAQPVPGERTSRKK